MSLLFAAQVSSQVPKIYVNLSTHNEMLNESYDTNEAEYDGAVTVINQVLTHVNSLGAKWNFQTCSKFVLGALNWDDAYNSNADILEQMYLSGNVEIDPRNKTQFPDYMYNISDVYHLLDSCGVTSTHTVGGFLHWPYENEDWTQFRTPKIGAVYYEPWQAEIIWGGGSPNHENDANNYGVWKPQDGDNETVFYTHDPNANLWLVGNGCAPVISDTTMDVQWIVNLVRDNVRKIQDNVWPQDKFYSLSLMINVRDFDEPGFYGRVETVLDSIQHYVDAGQMEWASISHKLELFESWSAANSIAYSQWSCDEALAASGELTAEAFTLYPNPVREALLLSGATQNVSVQISDACGKILNFSELKHAAGESRIPFDHLGPGIYFVRVGETTFKIIKE